MNYRKLLALLLSMLCLTAAAQQLGTWQLYLSYYIATKNVTAGSTVYSLMNGNLLSYDTEDGEVRTYDHLHTLSDIGISHIAYSKEADKLIIVYESSNIDLLDRDGNVYNAAAYLIAQLGKNYTNRANERVSGNELLYAAWEVLRNIQYRIGGSIVFVEAEDIPALLDFYTRNSFRVFGERESEEDHLVQLVRGIRQ